METTEQLRLRFPGAEICSIAEISLVTDVLECEDDDVVVVISSPPDGTTSLVRADAIVFAMGYEPRTPAACSVPPSRTASATRTVTYASVPAADWRRRSMSRARSTSSQ